MGAMIMIIIGVAVIVGEIPAVDVIPEAVAVVVDAVARNFAWIAPHVGREILVAIINARIDHRYDDIGVTLAQLPCLWCIDVLVVGLMHAPKLAKGWVVGR